MQNAADAPEASARNEFPEVGTCPNVRDWA